MWETSKVETGVGQIQQDNEPKTAEPSLTPIGEEPSAKAKTSVMISVVPRRSPWQKKLLVGLAFTATATFSAALGLFGALMVPVNPAVAPQQDEQFSLGDLWQRGLGYSITRPVTILVMGIDEVPNVPEDSPQILSGRSDTMLLVRVDPTDNTASILSIPRDTQVNIPNEGVTKINYANEAGGPHLAARVVSSNLNDVQIDRYVRISTGAFRELVDLIGGVRVNVPYRMEYRDDTQKLYIDLQPGLQILNGDQAEQFARFRHDGQGDVGRVQRQQQLIRALRERLTDPTLLPKLPQAIELIQQNLDTNLSLDEMLSLVGFGLNLDRDSFRMVMLPGRFSQPGEFIASYWIMDHEGRDRVLSQYFGVSPISVVGAEPRSVNQLRIAVQNASGQPDIGREMVNYLQENGFDNVYLVADANSSDSETQIIVQRGDLEGAQAVESILGIGHVVAASTGDLESDLTIRVGSDWVGQAPHGNL